MYRAKWPVKNVEDTCGSFEPRPVNFNPSKCETCIHFYPLVFECLQLSESNGECRVRGSAEKYPEVFTYDWCGEHRVMKDA